MHPRPGLELQFVPGFGRIPTHGRIMNVAGLPFKVERNAEEEHCIEATDDVKAGLQVSVKEDKNTYRC
jgi:hypothetical protein